MKILTHILFYSSLDIEWLRIQLEEKRKTLISITKEALKNGGEKEIELILNDDYYNFYVSSKIFKNIDESLVDFLMNSEDSERTAYYILDSKELGDD